MNKFYLNVLLRYPKVFRGRPLFRTFSYVLLSLFLISSIRSNAQTCSNPGTLMGWDFDSNLYYVLNSSANKVGSAITASTLRTMTIPDAVQIAGSSFITPASGKQDYSVRFPLGDVQFVPNSPNAARFTMHIQAGTKGKISNLSFDKRFFKTAVSTTGNDACGVRILKDGVEVYRGDNSEGVVNIWTTRQVPLNIDLDGKPTTLTFEILGYGTAQMFTEGDWFWALDNVKVQGCWCTNGKDQNNTVCSVAPVSNDTCAIPSTVIKWNFDGSNGIANTVSSILTPNTVRTMMGTYTFGMGSMMYNPATGLADNGAQFPLRESSFLPNSPNAARFTMHVKEGTFGTIKNFKFEKTSYQINIPARAPDPCGMRILKNGVEIFRATDIPVETSVWLLRNVPLNIELDGKPATFTFEILGYGTAQMVAASNWFWAIDNIEVQGCWCGNNSLNQTGVVCSNPPVPSENCAIPATVMRWNFDNSIRTATTVASIVDPSTVKTLMGTYTFAMGSMMYEPAVSMTDNGARFPLRETSFVPNSPNAARFTMHIKEGTVGAIRNLKFEKTSLQFTAPVPVRGADPCGIRVLKDGKEVFRAVDIPVVNNIWLLRNVPMDIELDGKPTTLTFEILGYGTAQMITQGNWFWELDNLEVQGCWCNGSVNQNSVACSVQPISNDTCAVPSTIIGWNFNNSDATASTLTSVVEPSTFKDMRGPFTFAMGSMMYNPATGMTDNAAQFPLRETSFVPDAPSGARFTFHIKAGTVGTIKNLKFEKTSYQINMPPARVADPCGIRVLKDGQEILVATDIPVENNVWLLRNVPMNIELDGKPTTLTFEILGYGTAQMLAENNWFWSIDNVAVQGCWCNGTVNQADETCNNAPSLSYCDNPGTILKWDFNNSTTTATAVAPIIAPATVRTLNGTYIMAAGSRMYTPDGTETDNAAEFDIRETSFVPNSPNAARFTFHVNAGTTGNITCLQFEAISYRRVIPIRVFDPIGARILKNGVEIFRVVDLPVASDVWLLRKIPLNIVLDGSAATYTVEILGYGTAEMITGGNWVWSIDNIMLKGCWCLNNLDQAQKSCNPLAANNDEATTPSNTPVTITPLSNDQIPSGCTVQSIAVVQQPNPATGSVTKSGNNFIFTPAAGFAGVTTFMYNVLSSCGTSNPAIVIVNVQPRLTANNDNATTPQNTPVTILPLSNDLVPSGCTVQSIGVVQQPTTGTVTKSGNNFIYTPANGFAGTVTFTYNILSSCGTSNPATVIVTVEPRPIANNDNATTKENVPVTITPLSNDQLPNGCTIESIAVVQQPNGGTVAVTGNNFVFTPETGFVGTATFTYNILSSCGTSNTATVTVNVTAQPRPIANNDNAATSPNTPVTITPLSNDQLPNGCTIQSIAVVQQPSSGGVVTVSGNNFVFTPATGFTGTTTFTYNILSSCGTSNTATVTVAVQPPTGTSNIKDVFVFYDNNNNRTYDAGDAPVQGVTVTLCNANNQIITTAITNALGAYSFLNLPAGTYIVKFPPTLADGKAITTTNPITITLGAGQTNSDADAGYYQPTTTNGSIGDFTFNDNNGNGVYDSGDTPKSNILVTLCNSAGQTLRTTLSVSGNYSFGNLAAGTYIVKFAPVHTDGKVLSTPQQFTVNLAAGQNFTSADAGYKTPGTTPTNGSIGDFTFNDNNGNGVYDTGDTPKSNILVTLCNSAGQTLTTALSVSGNYSFGNLAAGTYIVKFAPVHTDGKVLSTPQQFTVNLAAGQNFTSADAGYKTPGTTPTNGSIGDFTFNDNNGNGVYDTGDTPKSNILVTLCNSAGQTLKTTLSASGNYSFGNLVAGTYIVKFAPVHTDGKVLSTPQQFTVNLAAGQNFTSADAGYKTPGTTPTNGSIGDLTFNDNNGNGVYDTGDTPKSNILVTLCNSAGQTLKTTLSVSGLYSFSNLAAGTYIVKFAPVHTDGKVLTTPQQITVNLAAGQNYATADAGYKTPNTTLGSIGDLVFADSNNNGVYDNGDTPISGVTVSLHNSSNVFITSATTNSAGNYSFGGLAAGTYIVKFPATLADGKSITTPQQFTVNLTAGQNFVNADAGYFKQNTSGTSSIKDVFVYCDNNNNLLYDAGDAPIQGVTVSLYNSNNQIITTAITDADGAYSFLNLAAGTYIVKFPTTLADGKGITSTNPITITLGIGETSNNGDASYFLSSTVNCNATRNNTIVRACTNNIPVLIGTPLPGYEYMWLSSTSICPNTSVDAIAGATQQNYSLPNSVSQTTYFIRCARPIGCTTWGNITESNCLTVNASDCSVNGVKCDAVTVQGKTDGTISVTGIGNYTSYVQVINNQLQTVSNLEYNQPSVSIPVKNGAYSVNILLYDANNGGWIFLCEKTVAVTVSGSLAALSKNVILDINAHAEAQRAQIQWINNTGSQNDFFTVEKLNNTSGNFEKVETVNSKSTEGNEAYSVYDNAITEGANTYRVQLTMLDGQVKTSAVKTLTYKNLNDVRIYPNPASDFIDVDLKQYEGKKVTLYIYNQVGKLIQTKQIESASATPVHLDMDGQTNGQMLLRVTAEGNREVTKKFVIHN